MDDIKKTPGFVKHTVRLHEGARTQRKTECTIERIVKHKFQEDGTNLYQAH